jgi:hypothetical protein
MFPPASSGADPKNKNPGPKAPGFRNFEQTDSPLALFYVVASSWAEL